MCGGVVCDTKALSAGPLLLSDALSSVSAAAPQDLRKWANRVGVKATNLQDAMDHEDPILVRRPQLTLPTDILQPICQLTFCNRCVQLTPPTDASTDASTAALTDMPPPAQTNDLIIELIVHKELVLLGLHEASVGFGRIVALYYL